VEHEDGESNDEEEDAADEHDEVERSSWRDEQLQAPRGDICRLSGLCEDDHLRVGDDWRPHALGSLALRRCRSRERLNVVVRPANSQEGIRQVQAVVA